MQHQCCDDDDDDDDDDNDDDDDDDDDDTAVIENNGVTTKWVTNPFSSDSIIFNGSCITRVVTVLMLPH